MVTCDGFKMVNDNSEGRIMPTANEIKIPLQIPVSQEEAFRKHPVPEKHLSAFLHLWFLFQLGSLGCK